MLYRITNCLFFVSISLLCVNAEATVFTSLPTDIQEPAGIYYPTPPNVLRIDAQTRIGTGPCIPGDYSGCTLEDVNNDIDPSDNFKPEIKIHFTADDFPDDGKVSNATLRLRGNTSRLEDLKSYRIKLDSKKKLWRGERRLQLNKHTSDLTRIKNKLSFDLMTTIPNLPSLRTQFANLFIDGLDYGFYTHVEHVGKEYLQRRNWDKDSGVYKAEDFDFTMQNELLLDSQGEPVNPDSFETILEIKRGNDHSKLLEMITAVNDTTNDFKTDVLNKYFNVNNFLTWEAVIILMGNTDVTTYNYYLYNPKGTDQFYFLPWDFDATWGYDWHSTIVEGGFVPARRYQGPHNLWATAFGRRFLLQPGALDLLTQAVLEIKQNYLTPAKINSYSSSYYNLVYPFITRQPDIDYLDSNKPTESGVFAEYNSVYNGLAATVQRNYERFLKIKNSPMPFHIDTPYLEGTNIVFSWEAAVDLQGDTVTYDLEVASNPEFKAGDIKFSINNLTTTTYTTPWMLPRGNYYFRITARDTSNPSENWQLAFEEYYDANTDFTGYGIEPFSVNFDSVPPLQITIDGNQNDWSNQPFSTDPDDVVESNVVDWRQAWLAQDTDNIYFAYLNDDNINVSKLWAWNAYIDTDNNSVTGYQIGSIGTEYLLQGDELWKYTGDGTSWSWQLISTVAHAVNGQFAEFSIPKAQLDSTSNFTMLLYGANSFINNTSPVDLMLVQPVTP